jgi:hypothetical protein
VGLEAHPPNLHLRIHVSTLTRRSSKHGNTDGRVQVTVQQSRTPQNSTSSSMSPPSSGMRRSFSQKVAMLAMMAALSKRWRGAGALSSSSASSSGGASRSAAALSPSNPSNPSPADRATRRTFQFVPFGVAAPTGVTTISCDGLVSGASFDVTHWTNNRTPEPLYADTSTEIALNLAKAGGDDEKYAHLVDAVVLNNHYDTDGALSVFACLNPSLALQHASLLAQAAEAGDFGEWSSDAGVQLDCALMSLKESCDSEAEAYDRALELLPDLLRDVANQGGLYESLWRAVFNEAMAGYHDLMEGRAVLSRGPGTMAVLNERLGSRLSPFALHRGLVEADLWRGHDPHLARPASARRRQVPVPVRVRDAGARVGDQAQGSSGDFRL